MALPHDPATTNVDRAPLTRRRFVTGAGVALTSPLWLSATAFGSGCSTELNRLVFLNWLDYIDPKLLDDFTAEFGASVTYETYASNDELSRRLNASSAKRRGRQATTFDLIVPSDNLVRTLRSNGLLRELPAGLVGLDNLDPAFRKLDFDPGNRFTIPWATGTTGLGYSRRAFPDGPPDWSAFEDPDIAPKSTLLAETRDAVAAGLFLMGEDPNATSAREISAAGERVRALVDGGVSVDAETYLDRLEDGSTVLAQAYSSDVAQAARRNDDLAFVIPESGGLRWIDSLCIPVKAPSPDLAARFIEFYLRPEVAASNAASVRVSTGNRAAIDFVPAEVSDDPIVNPSDDDLERTTFTSELDDATQKLYDEAFAEITG